MFSGISAEGAVDLFGQPPRDALDAAQILDGRRLDAIQPAELRQQFAAPRRADAGDIFKPGAAARLGAPGAMANDGETVRLVAYFLYQVEARMVHGQL
jgi:hypothetical protein